MLNLGPDMSEVSVELLRNTSQLITQIPSSFVTVLLFTAVWSIESQYARDVVRNAVSRVQCGSMPIRAYELQWPLSSDELKKLHTDDSVSDRRTTSAYRLSQYRLKSEGHGNITSAIKWFPAVQLFTNQTGYVRPFRYTESFDEETMVLHLKQFCESDDILLPSQLDSNTKSVEQSYSPIRILSKDEFARAMHDSSQHRKQELGMLIIVAGGLPLLTKRHETAWRVISTAINSSNSQNSFDWVLTVLDSKSHTNMAYRLGALNITDHNGIAVVLLNRRTDEVEIVDFASVADTVIRFYDVITSFAREKPLSNNTHVNPVQDVSTKHMIDIRINAENSDERKLQLLRVINRPNAWQEHFSEEQDRVSLVDWLRGNYGTKEVTGSMVWIVVYERWCAFCQRHMGVYRRFKNMVKDAHVPVEVMMVEGCHKLSNWMDGMVNGYPTVLKLRSFGSYLFVDEYTGEHKIEALLGELNNV